MERRRQRQLHNPNHDARPSSSMKPETSELQILTREQLQRAKAPAQVHMESSYERAINM
ncbi:conserved hypothetical protein [Ricinus communis]|uniref:Uncharacterized protein n=1 Tax=Ricinus communis TaxID=3988 RepID=B9SJL1_RICCO|nr:conserved hypothetical protein [Ricinus communis]